MNSKETAVVLKISKAQSCDAMALLALQKVAYQSEAEVYQDWSIAPLLETEEDFLGALENQHVLVARLAEHIAESVRVEMDGTTSRIGRLFVDPKMLGMGLGRQLIQAAEQAFGSASRYQLFTGNKSHGNIAFYEKLGYRQVGEQQISEKVTLTILEKPGRT